MSALGQHVPGLLGQNLLPVAVLTLLKVLPCDLAKVLLLHLVLQELLVQVQILELLQTLEEAFLCDSQLDDIWQ
jgi:hypothetical protein